MDSKLTAGGVYVTAELKASFKGYYQLSPHKEAALVRPFIQYEGEGDTANARARQIGGHPAELLKHVCRRNDLQSPYATPDGYVPFGTLLNYAGGRSDGCTTWSPSEAEKVVATVKDRPTTLYIYPAATDIEAMAPAIAGGGALPRRPYWDSSCLKEIRAPKFWPKETLEPLLAQYEKSHPAPPESPPPICKPH